MKQNLATQTGKPLIKETEVSFADATAPIKDAKDIFGIVCLFIFISAIDKQLKWTI